MPSSLSAVHNWSLALALVVATGGCAVDDALDSSESDVTTDKRHKAPKTRTRNDSGASRTVSTDGSIDFENEFFEDFGTNGRTCVTCHVPGEGWSIAADEVERLFERSRGRAPLFRTVDGANSPDADVSTYSARRAAYSMLRTRGTIRVGIGVPADAEFELVAVDDPYGYATASELSLFRRPLPSANLRFAPVVMWDGRETGATLEEGLTGQANGATLGHAEAIDPLSQEQRDSIVAFETSLFNAQFRLRGVGRLDRDGARGGPDALAEQADEAGRFDLFDAWADSDNPRRAAIARGQELFNNPGPTGRRCGGCHNTANVGTSQAPIFFNVQTSSADIRTPDMPLYTFRDLATGEVFETTDPGRALITGRTADMNRFKAPSLRALSARAPYFHNGSAATLEDVVTHYEDFLGFVFTEQERADLVAFLSAL